MSRTLPDGFCWGHIQGQKGEELTDAEKYKRIVRWAAQARGQNPGAFDALTGWVLDDSQWSNEKLPENEQILMRGVLARFQEQNARLRAYLSELTPSGVVNPAVFKALDRFDEELSGLVHDKGLQEAVARVFADFSAMGERGIREQIAGSKTGPTGTDTVDMFGYINYLKECDAQVQWALFMPDLVLWSRGSKRASKWTALNTEKCPLCALWGGKAMTWTTWRPARSFFGVWTP